MHFRRNIDCNNLQILTATLFFSKSKSDFMQRVYLNKSLFPIAFHFGFIIVTLVMR